jgi:hypothetical protein
MNICLPLSQDVHRTNILVGKGHITLNYIVVTLLRVGRPDKNKMDNMERGYIWKISEGMSML